MKKFDLPHTKEDELQSLSIDDWIINVHLHFDKTDMKILKKLIDVLKNFLEYPMDWYIWIDYIDIWWDISYWLWYQDKQWLMQIWFDWCDVWLDLTKAQLTTMIKKLEKCYDNLKNQ